MMRIVFTTSLSSEVRMVFEHGYALIVGVGRSAYPAWSLPTTAQGTRPALRAALGDPEKVLAEAHAKAQSRKEGCRFRPFWVSSR